MTYTETCSCGASVTITGWGIRHIDNTEWKQKHSRCKPPDPRMTPVIPTLRRTR